MDFQSTTVTPIRGGAITVAEARAFIGKADQADRHPDLVPAEQIEHEAQWLAARSRREGPIFVGPTRMTRAPHVRRGRCSRVSTNAPARGSRRSSERSGDSGDDGGGSEPHPCGTCRPLCPKRVICRLIHARLAAIRGNEQLVLGEVA